MSAVCQGCKQNTAFFCRKCALFKIDHRVIPTDDHSGTKANPKAKDIFLTITIVTIEALMYAMCVSLLMGLLSFIAIELSGVTVTEAIKEQVFILIMIASIMSLILYVLAKTQVLGDKE